jgi:hypothetical protein
MSEGENMTTLESGAAVVWGDETLATFEWSDCGTRRVIQVVTEVPKDADGGVLPRRGNRWYPSMLRVATGGPEYDPPTMLLMPEDARELAAQLIAAADTADRVDKPDTDPCGHWAPCSCQQGH